MRVLVACEFSGIVRDAFRDDGHDAMSCDLLPSPQPPEPRKGDSPVTSPESRVALDLADIEARHIKSEPRFPEAPEWDDGYPLRCVEDLQEWPCDARRLLDAINGLPSPGPLPQAGPGDGAVSRLSKRRPYFTTFQRHVRWLQMPASSGVPLDMVQDTIRRELNGDKHTVVENSWKDEHGYYTLPELRAFLSDDGVTGSRRVVSVRYVTGGMRHGLGTSTELAPSVSVVEFTRAHNLPKPPRETA